MIVIIYFMEEINMRVLENCEPKKVFYYFVGNLQDPAWFQKHQTDQ